MLHIRLIDHRRRRAVDVDAAKEYAVRRTLDPYTFDADLISAVRFGLNDVCLFDAGGSVLARMHGDRYTKLRNSLAEFYPVLAE
jgi:hypothetical protein